MADWRGISEGELVKEIIELWKDARMYCDKINVFDNGCRAIDMSNSRHVDSFYFRHILTLDKIRLLITIGQKYFPVGVDWDFYNVSEKLESISFENKSMVDILNGGKKCYTLAYIDDAFLGFR